MFRSATIRWIQASCCASFLAEYRQLRPDDVEQLQNDGEHSIEMAGSGVPFQHRSQGARVDGNLPRGRVKVGDARHEDDINAIRLADLKIILKGPRITRIVLAGPKLQRIDEDADPDHIAK
jgi:hypothetical protein